MALKMELWPSDSAYGRGAMHSIQFRNLEPLT